MYLPALYEGYYVDLIDEHPDKCLFNILAYYLAIIIQLHKTFG